MSRTPFVAGNWKMNTTRSTAVELASGVVQGAASGVDVGVAPPFVYLDAVGQALAGTRVWLGAQDVYFEKDGAFTGEISVEMLKDLGVRFCLTGHSERRHVIGESGELVAKKAAAVYAGGLTLVHCVGEKIEQREAGQTFAVVQRQLDELGAGMNDPSRLVIAYEPVWAIGTGKNATEQQAQEVHAYIRDSLSRKWNSDFAGRVRILYGGSARPENVAGLLRQPDLDGGLVGGASLKPELFNLIVNLAVQQLAATQPKSS
jgi:triosephosphate isomerase